jgi:hypothetical protein
MAMERNTGIPMRDGAVLRGDVFRPKADGKFPVLMTFGPYGNDVPLKEFMQEAWDAIELGAGRLHRHRRPGETGVTKGVGWMYHTDPGDRSPAIFHGTHAVHTGSGRDSYLLLPVLPAS